MDRLRTNESDSDLDLPPLDGEEDGGPTVMEADEELDGGALGLDDSTGERDPIAPGDFDIDVDTADDPSGEEQLRDISEFLDEPTDEPMAIDEGLNGNADAGTPNDAIQWDDPENTEDTTDTGEEGPVEPDVEDLEEDLPPAEFEDPTSVPEEAPWVPDEMEPLRPVRDQ